MISFGLSALLRVSGPSDPARAVGRELRERGVAVPDDWPAVYHANGVDSPPGAAVPEPAHVARTLAAAGVDAPDNTPRRAVVAAFDPTVETRPGAVEAVAAAGERGPVGVLANVAVPAVTRRALLRSALDRDAFDAVCSSAACGWRKPHPRAFAAVARRLGGELEELVHVGREEADRGVRDAGGRFRDARESSLAELAAEWRE